MQDSRQVVYENSNVLPEDQYEVYWSPSNPSAAQSSDNQATESDIKAHQTSRQANLMIKEVLVTEICGSPPMKVAVVGLVIVLVCFFTMIGLHFQQQSEWKKETGELNVKIMQLISVKLKQLEESDKKIVMKIMDVANETAAVDSKISALLGTATGKAIRLIGLNWNMSGNGKVVYKCFTDPTTNYSAANASCHGLGGRLASKALRDQIAVLSIQSSACRNDAWIGYFQIRLEWHWADGGATNNSTTTWQVGEPNGGEPGGFCAESYASRDGKIALNDHDCSVNRGRICEIDL